MYIGRTWQDYQESSDKEQFLFACVEDYMAGKWYQNAVAAQRYSKGRTDVLTTRKKMAMQPVSYKDDAGRVRRTGELREISTNYIADNIFGRLVQQRTQYLFQGGLNLEQEAKDRLGAGFDRQMEKCAVNAVLHGESYLFWAGDHAENMPAAGSDGASGMFFLLDEMTSEPMLGLRFWHLSADKPMYLQVYSADGWILYRTKDGKREVIEQMGYIQRIMADALGESRAQEGYAQLPFAIFRANEDGESAFTPNIKSKIDLYDKILSDFGDNLERMEGIYWVIKNFGGSTMEARAMLAELETLRTAVGHDDGQEAHPESIEAPYAARQFALECLEKALYKDFMALNMDTITGGSLTNVAIQAAKANLDLAANELETHAFDCIAQLLEIIGVPELYEMIGKYNRQAVSNKLETVQMVYSTGLAQDLPRRKRLELTGLFEADEIEEIMTDMDAEDVTGIDDMSRLSAIVSGEA